MMKNKFIATALVVGMLAAQTLCVYGASSSSSSTSVSSGSTTTTTTATVGVPSGSASATTNEAVLEVLPTETAAQVAEQMQAINSGASLKDVVTANVALDNYRTLTATAAITVAKVADAATANVAIYVPNLVGNFSSVQILFMDSTTGLWTVLPLTAIDFATKTISVDLPGSGIYSVVYEQSVIQAGV